MDLDKKIGRNFRLREFVESNTQRRLDIDNTPTKEILYNLEFLVKNILDPVREELKKPIIVNSGYRCKKLNKAVGGSSRSAHVFGQAADIECVGLDNAKLAYHIYKNFNFHQLLLEFYRPGEPRSGWVHVHTFDSSLYRRDLKMEFAMITKTGKHHLDDNNFQDRTNG